MAVDSMDVVYIALPPAQKDSLGKEQLVKDVEQLQLQWQAHYTSFD